MSWTWILAHNLTISLALEKSKLQGWWDGAGYHRDEAQLVRRVKQPENKGPAWTSGSPQAGSLNRAAA